MPDFVKEASSEDLYGTTKLAGGDIVGPRYAEPVTKQFPCHTAPATWMSVLFFNDSRDQFSKSAAEVIEQRLGYFARIHGITTEVQKLNGVMKVAAANPLTSLPNEDFALIISTPDGHAERHYPLRNNLEIKKAADYLSKYKEVIPLAERQEMAKRILDKAASHGTKLDPEIDVFLEKQAGYGVCSADDAMRLVNSRIVAMRHFPSENDVRLELEKIAQTCKESPAQVRSSGARQKLAVVIDQLDRTYGFHRKYSETLPAPEDVLFGITVKEASSLVDEHCTTTTGNVYKIADFQKVPLDDIKDVLGDEFANEVSVGGLLTSPTKLAEQAAALPRPDAELLDKLLSHVGVRPEAQEAALNDSWLNKGALHELARMRNK